MTQIADIIVQGLRESNLIDATANPTPTETDEALARLQSIILSVLGSEVGYIMEDWNITSATAIKKPTGVPLSTAQASAYTVKPNSRLIMTLAAPLTINLDPQPQDGQRFSVIDAGNTFDTQNLTINPNGRKFEGLVANKVVSTEGFAKQWLYRADIADWKVIDPIITTDDMPFPADFDDYFIIMLAMRMNPRYGKSLMPESVQRLTQQQEQFINRYTQSRLRSNPSPRFSNPARDMEAK